MPVQPIPEKVYLKEAANATLLTHLLVFLLGIVATPIRKGMKKVEDE